MRYVYAVIAIFMSSTLVSADDTHKQAVSDTLDAFHRAASEAAWDTYFGLMSDDAIFLGTDATERWDKPTFRAYATPTKGWSYSVTARHINFTPDGDTAWFDELLTNAKYGLSRGTGVLIRGESGWKISQYHLTFPIPNELADGITQQIQIFEERQKMGQQ